MQVADREIESFRFGMKATTHRTSGVSPGAVVFHRDMIMDLPFVADLLLLRNKRQQLIDYNLRRENYRRRSFDYQPGQWVLELTTSPGKLRQSTKGPYRVDRVHCNGTVSIRRTENIVDRVNI